MPRAPKKCGRPGCEERVVGQPYCPGCTAAQQAASGWGRGSTRASRALRDQVLALHPVCYLSYEGCTTVSTRDDHVIPLAEGGSDDLSNHAGACAHCHDIKTQREAARGRTRGRPARHPTTGGGGRRR